MISLDESTPWRQLDSRLDLANHPPTDFEAGYFGTSVAQAALAILAKFTGDDALALRLYQTFSREVVANWTQANWYVIGDALARWVQVHTSERGDRLGD